MTRAPRDARARRLPIALASALVATLLAIACGRAPAPAAAPTPVSDPVSADTAEASRARARAALRRSLAALGDRDGSRAARGFEIVLEARPARAGWQQARRWTDSTPLPVPTTLRYLVDGARRRAMYELDSPAPGDIWFRYLTHYDTAGAWQIDRMRWRLGDDIVRGTAAQARAAIASAERLLPHAAVRQALLADSALRHLGVRARDGRRLEAIAWPDPATRQLVTLELDPATALPASIAGPGPASQDLDEYRVVDGVRVPFRRVQRTGGAVTGEQRVVRVAVRPRLDEARFAMPAGYADPPAPGAPRATRLGEGVYRLDDMPTGYHAAFVVGDSGVMVLEAPQSAPYTEAALRVIEATAPGRPITHVFVTHHHADHVGGLGPYVARGATLVVGAGLEEPVRRQLPEGLRAQARFAPVSGRQSFGRGAARVDAYPVPNTHAEGNVAYHLPASRVLFHGDLFYIPERGEVPPAFPVTEALARVVREQGLAVEHVVGVHGRTGTWAEVELSLRRAAGAR